MAQRWHCFLPVDSIPELWRHVEALEETVQVAGHGLVHQAHVTCNKCISWAESEKIYHLFIIPST